MIATITRAIDMYIDPFWEILVVWSVAEGEHQGKAFPPKSLERILRSRILRYVFD